MSAPDDDGKLHSPHGEYNDVLRHLKETGRLPDRLAETADDTAPSDTTNATTAVAEA